MKYLRVFESWVNEGKTPEQIANLIQAAVGGIGTDEDALLAAIKLIPDSNTLAKINSLFKTGSGYSYQSVNQAVEGELSFMDQDILDQIKAHLTKLGSASPAPANLDLISQIMPRVIQHEGKKDTVYKDSRGIPTIGVGFNLNRADSSALLKQVGADPVKIKAGTAKLSDYQITTLLKKDLEEAKVNAQALVSNWQKLPQAVQGVLIEMTFNLGRRGLSEFKNFLSHINSRKFIEASKEMLNSTWAKQVGDRAKTLSDIIKSAK